MAKMYEIIGYTYDGAAYGLHNLPKRTVGHDPCVCASDELDQHGMCQENCTGYGPHPIFAGDEDAEDTICDGCWDPVGDCACADDPPCEGCDAYESDCLCGSECDGCGELEDDCSCVDDRVQCRYCLNDAYPGSDACGSCNQAIYDEENGGPGF